MTKISKSIVWEGQPGNTINRIDRASPVLAKEKNIHYAIERDVFQEALHSVYISIHLRAKHVFIWTFNLVEAKSKAKRKMFQ